ncbi:Fatty acid desaturase [Symmachiella dynata]|uniref:Fatty acid desaturase n=1 Tax=Symmachiella dynata TaxID=2527995 RepID=A0A517ZH83_9PLAN|nr:fatty acid desaturase family protein [Symmachiella dynata]QDU41809.1 Fatty acid desaturase [Symmachiella dynata]
MSTTTNDDQATQLAETHELAATEMQEILSGQTQTRGETDAVSPGEIRLTDEFRQRLRELSKLTPGRGLAAIACDWAMIAACFTAAIMFPHPLVWVGCAILIAARQHALLIIMHDASHFRIVSSRRWNDRLSNWLLAWPVLVSTEGYRANHLAHHSHLNTDDDPDWTRKEGKPEWEFPKTRWALAKLLARDLCGGGFLDMLKAIGDLSSQKPKADEAKPRPWGKLCYYVLLATAVTVTGMWVPVLLLWYLPAFTILPVILRLRSIAEHFGLEGEHDLNMSRNFAAGPVERLLFAPHNVGYHLDHHLFPSVPYYNLPQLHAALLKHPEYADHAHQNDSLLGLRGKSVLNDVLPA